jgi:hypothetical protein
MYGQTEFVVIVLILVVLALLIGLPWSDSRRVSTHKKTALLTLDGWGEEYSDELYLPAGLYQIDYRFLAKVSTSVELINATTGKRRALVTSTGFGSSQFRIDPNGKYLFYIQPAERSAQWQIHIEPLLQAVREPKADVAGA